MLLDVVLNLFLELLGRFCVLGKNNGRLNNLSSYIVGSSGNAALKNIRKLHDNIFDLERSDAVAGRLDNVINTADIPEVTILISPCDITCVINAVVPNLVCFFLISVVAEEYSARYLFGGIDADFAGFTDVGFRSVGTENFDIV